MEQKIGPILEENFSHSFVFVASSENSKHNKP